jgi:cobalt/nickel transport system permease protein
MFTTSSFDYYQAGNSVVHRADPRVKLVATLGIILSNVLLPDDAWLAFGSTWVVILCLIRLSKIKFRFIFKRSLVAIPFALVAFTVMFTIPGDIIARFNIFGWDLAISLEGFIRFISIMVRAWLSIQAAILLTATTTFPDLAHGLRHLRVPLILIAILSFMYRYLFVLSEEAERLLQARAARSARIPGTKSPPIFWRAKNAGNMVGQLFLRSYERSDRVYNAMVARGFKGQFLTFRPHVMDRSDWLYMIEIFLILVVIQLIPLLV